MQLMGKGAELTNSQATVLISAGVNVDMLAKVQSTAYTAYTQVTPHNLTLARIRLLLCCAVLCCAVLCCAVLCNVDSNLYPT